MKIQTLQKFKTKLLELKLLKTKIYKLNDKLTYFRFKDTETGLKRIFHILYKFHIMNKKILFVGTPLKLNDQSKKFLQLNKHKFLPDFLWMNGILTNPRTTFKYLNQQHALTPTKSLKLLLSLNTQIDLIVVLNEQNNLRSLNEILFKRIPVIALNSTYDLSNLNSSTYTISGNSKFVEKPNQEKFFFLLLKSLLKRAEILRKKQIQLKLEREKRKKKNLQKKRFRRRSNYKRNGFAKRKK